jgi:hypothetical protein
MNTIGLSELIDQIKRELLKPPADDEALFAVGSIEVEVAFTATRAANGGINLQVVSLGTDGSSERVQRVTVALEPLVTVEEQRAAHRQRFPQKHVEVSRILTRGETEA